MDTDSASSSGGSERNLVTAMTSSSPPPPPGTKGNGGRNGNHFSPLTNGSVPPGSSNNIIMCNGPAKGPNDASAPADGSHGNKPSPWASANGAGLTPGTLNPKVNHSAWPGPQGPSGCKIVQQGGSLGWGGTQPDSLSLSEQPQRLLLNDTTVKTRHLNTTNGPNNTTNAIDTSSLPNSTGGSVHRNESGSGLRSWGAGGGGGDQLSNGTLSGAQHPHSEGLAGGFSKPWGASGPGDTVNGQGHGQPSPAAAVYNSKTNSKAPVGRWDSASPHNLGTGGGASNGNGLGPAGIPRPWAASSNRQPPNGEWSSLPGNKSQDSGDGRKSGGGANGWKSLEDDALRMGGGGGGVQGPASVGASGSSEGSGESSGGPSLDRDRNDPCRQGPLPGSTQVLFCSDVDPRVLCNTGWGQTPVRQDTAWDVTSPVPRPDDRKPSNVGPGWGSKSHAARSHTSSSGGWRWEEGAARAQSQEGLAG
uniref:Uncharacterized protein n=1 Tax=Oncorhynchus tshawytscha TaxID=74940 RepID=A0AAZ3PGK6_ONCTS